MFVVLDTNHFRELQVDSAAGKGLTRRIDERAADVFSCIVAAEESLHGWITFIRKHPAGAEQIEAYGQFQACIQALNKLAILPFDSDAADIFRRLQATHRRTGTMDLKIAAICLAHEATLLTRNLRGFDGIAGLQVANWLD